MMGCNSVLLSVLLDRSHLTVSLIPGEQRSCFTSDSPCFSAGMCLAASLSALPVPQVANHFF